MLITISTTGGLGGFGSSRPTEVDVGDLPPELRAETCVRLAPEELRVLAGKPVPESADRVIYRFVIAGPGDTAARFEVPEGVLPDATLDLIDSLMEHAETE